MHIILALNLMQTAAAENKFCVTPYNFVGNKSITTRKFNIFVIIATCINFTSNISLFNNWTL